MIVWDTKTEQPKEVKYGSYSVNSFSKFACYVDALPEFIEKYERWKSDQVSVKLKDYRSNEVSKLLSLRRAEINVLKNHNFSIKYMRTISQLQSLRDWQNCTRDIPACGLLVFKFSPRCPISRSIERDFDQWCEQLEETVPLRCAKVDVVQARELSQHIARELNVRHESPQAIWLVSSHKVSWHASHRAISAQALRGQLERMKSLLA